MLITGTRTRRPILLIASLVGFSLCAIGFSYGQDNPASQQTSPRDRVQEESDSGSAKAINEPSAFVPTVTDAPSNLIGAGTRGLAGKRVALVIGNSQYEAVAALANPHNDANAIAGVLREIGFDEVKLVENLDYSGMRRTLKDFATDALGSEVALIYYAGHGVEVGGTNYLVPTDAALLNARDVDFEALPLDHLRSAVSGAGQLRLVILDACRNNPFKLASSDGKRGVGRGLARVESDANELIAYAAREGTLASDGTGKGNSPFATALIRHMRTPGLEINFLFRKVRDDVLSATSNEQEPYVYGSLGGEAIYLNPPKGGGSQVTSVPVDTPPPPQPNVEIVFWRSIEDSNNPADFQAYLERYPEGEFARLAEIRLAAVESELAPTTEERTLNPTVNSSNAEVVDELVSPFSCDDVLQYVNARVRGHLQPDARERRNVDKQNSDEESAIDTYNDPKTGHVTRIYRVRGPQGKDYFIETSLTDDSASQKLGCFDENSDGTFSAPLPDGVDGITLSTAFYDPTRPIEGRRGQGKRRGEGNGKGRGQGKRRGGQGDQIGTAERPRIPADDRAAIPALRAYNQGNFEEALKLLRPLVEQGNARAQNLLGFMLASGRGVTEDVDEANRLFRLAADQGNERAKFNLGESYRLGRGVQQNDAEAVRWYRLSSDQGFAPAQSWLGVMYRDGLGVPQDDGEAVKWLQLASDQGDPHAQNNLGVMYRDGRGVPSDHAKALELFRHAAGKNNPYAEFNLGLAYANGTGVAQDDEEAVKWFLQSAEQGNAAAQDQLAYRYLNGLGVPQDDFEALRWAQLAANQGNADGQAKLGLMFEEGRGVAADMDQAVKWYQLAAEGGLSWAQQKLSTIYYQGKGVAQDRAEATKWTKLAAEGGDASAQFSLGYIYANGDGVEENLEEAVRWYRKAGENGDARGYNNLAFMYEEGRGVAQDRSQAAEMFRLAALLGHAGAQDNLGLKYLNGEGVEKDTAKAYAWFGIAAARGAEFAPEHRAQAARQLGDVQRQQARELARQLLSEVKADWRQSAQDDRTTLVQRALTELAYDPGMIDGDFGRRTAQAISDFQADNDLPQTGEIDAGLLTALRLQTIEAVTSASTAATNDETSTPKISNNAATIFTYWVKKNGKGDQPFFSGVGPTLEIAKQKAFRHCGGSCKTIGSGPGCLTMTTKVSKQVLRPDGC